MTEADFLKTLIVLFPIFIKQSLQFYAVPYTVYYTEPS